MGRGMQETNERSRQESGNVESIVPSPARFCKDWDVGEDRREGGGVGGYQRRGKGGETGCEKSHLTVKQTVGPAASKSRLWALGCEPAWPAGTAASCL